MPLFDDIHRDFEGPASHTESTFDWLNRSARADVANVRDELERWFSNYPADEQSSLRRRFRTEFGAAFFELFLHELLLQCAYEVTIHPTVPGTSSRPDFLAERGSDGFYLEATLATDVSDEERAAEAVKNALYDQINKIDSPNFFLDIHRLEIEPGTQPAARRIKAFLRKKLATVDPDELERVVKEEGLYALPSWTFDELGVRLEVRPIPKSKGFRGREGLRPIGIYPSQSGWGGAAPALRDAVLDKARAYGTPDRPYVIAVNSISGWGMDREDVMNALFGAEQVVISVERPEEQQMTRARDGVFVSNSGPQYKRVSAVIVGLVLPWNIPRADFELYHNPWAANTLARHVLPVAQALPYGDRLRHVAGQPLHRIFGLPEEWPGD